jgi:hypothetical protein
MVLGAILVLLGSAAPASAQQPASVRLDYERGDGASSCPDANVVASSVAERLGYEPFDKAASDAVKVKVFGKERGLQARIERFGADGKSKAERVLSSRRSDCADLAATMALAIAIAIDPFRATAPSPASVAALPPPQPEPLTSAQPRPDAKEREPVPSIVVAMPPASPPPPAVPRQPITGRAAFGVVGGVGSAPVRNLGVFLRVGARRADLSIDVEGRADLPASVPLRVGDVSTSLLVGSLVPCIHWHVMAGCGLVTGGALRAAGHGLVDSRQVTDPYFALGARLAVEVPMMAKLYLVAHADASAPLITTELTVGGDELWTTPPISILAGLGLAGAFP